MRRFGLVLASMLALGGCVTAPHYVAGDGDYYYDEPRAVVGYMPDYFAYSAYYSALWPVYCPWWDAFCDSFHYGVTFFPNRYFGLGYNYGFGFAYSPWYGSWWDSYYDWNWWHYHRRYVTYDAYHRFGSAQNEARAVAMVSRDVTPRASRLRTAPAEAAAVGGMQGATLRSRSTPMGGSGQERLRRDSLADERALDPYYGAPVRRSAGMDEERSMRRVPDSGAPARGRRFSSSGDDFDDGGRAARHSESALPRSWSVPRGDDGRPGRAAARDDVYSAPRQDSTRSAPRESARDFAPSAPAMRSAPEPVRSAPVSAPPARSSRDDGND